MLPPHLKKVFQLVGQTYLVTVVGLFIGIFSARGLQVEDRGLLALSLLIIQLTSRIGSIGFEQLIHEYGTSIQRQSLYIAGAIGGLIALPAAITLLWGSKISLVLLILAPLLAGLVAAMRINIALLVHYEEIKRLTIFNLSQSVSQLVLYALAFLSHDVNYFFIAWAINTVLFSVYSFIIIRNLVDEDPNAAKLSILESWQRGSKYTGMVVPEMALFFCLELPVIKSVLGAYSTGLYSISNTITSIYYQLFVAVTSIFIKYKQLSKKIIIYILLGIICFLIWLIAPYIINLLFGERYTQSLYFLDFMLPVTYIIGISRIEYMLSDNTSIWARLLPSTLLVTMISLGFFVPKANLILWIVTSYLIFAAITILSQRIFKPDKLNVI